MTEEKKSDDVESSLNTKTESHLETEDIPNPSNQLESIQTKGNIIRNVSESSSDKQISLNVDVNQLKNDAEKEKNSRGMGKTKVNETSTIATSTMILNKSDIIGEKDPYNNLNLQNLEKKKMSAIELGQQGKDKEKMGFFGKTKQWAGNVWRSMTSINLGQMWAKPEFEECFDSAGNRIKVPKKKIPLKKQPKKEIDPEEKKAIYEIKQEQQNYEVKSFDSFPYGGFFM